MVGDVCTRLAGMGHSVTVLTGVPNYPEGRIYPGYEKGRRREEVIGGVKVLRCATFPRGDGSFIPRALNYYSFPISSTLKALALKEKFDVVFIYQLSPVMMARAGLRFAEKHGLRTVLYCLDLWPESLAAGGVSRGSLMYRLYKGVSRRIYRKIDTIFVTSEEFRDYFVEKLGIDREKISFLAQYAESIFIYESSAGPKEEKDTVDLMFAGNIGKAQDVETIIRAAEILRENKKLRFHIVGDGTDAERCIKLKEDLGLENVVFYGRRPREQMPRLYSLADAMLISLSPDPEISRTVPAKLQSYMAAGKPVIGAIGGAGAKVISASGCGFCAPAGDSAGLARCIDLFIACEDRDKLSANAKKYYNENFRSSIFFERLVKALEGKKSVYDR